MTKTIHIILLATTIVAIGTIMLTSALTTEAEAKTKTDQQKFKGDFLRASADDRPAVPCTFVRADASQFAADSSDVFLSYSVRTFCTFPSSSSFANCIADKSVLQGSGTGKIELNVDTTTFVSVPSPTSPGECRFFTFGPSPVSPAGIVSVEVQRDGLSNFKFTGTQTSCFQIGGGTQLCRQTVGSEESGSAQINSGTVLGIDITTFPNQFGDAGKQNQIFKQWTDP